MSRILIIDLTDKSIKEEAVPIGRYGRGLAMELIRRHSKEGCERLSPDNTFVVVPGLLTGCHVPCATRATVAARSDNGFAVTSITGDMPQKLASLGISGLVIKGRYECGRCAVYMDGDAVRIFPVPGMDGLTCGDIVENIRKKYGSDCAVIAMLGDDPEDYMARSAVKWLLRLGVNILTMSPAKKDYGHHNYPLERIEKAMAWLKLHGNEKIGIAGASTTRTLALTAASIFSDISLTIAMTPSDFVWQGFMQGKKDGCKEWPMVGESLFSYKGKPLPYMPFCYQHPDYWHCIAAESKRTGDMVNSRKLFDDSEAAHPIRPEEFIPIENIRGKLLLIGAEDDVLWDTAKYIRRMEKRLAEKQHTCDVEAAVYEHGTHFVFPEGMLKTMLPIGSGLFVKLAFKAAKKYPEECRKTRMDIEVLMTRAIAEWKGVRK